MSKRWAALLAAVLLVASFAEFAVRGPLRLTHSPGWNDFLSPYIQTQAWVHGQDPYSAQSLLAWWPSDDPRPAFVDDEAADGTLESKRGMPSPYPLTTLVMLAPFAALPWTVALSCWCALNMAAVILAAFALLSICGCKVAEIRSQLFLAAVFGLAPVHTGLSTANPVILAVSLAVVSLWAAGRGRDRTAGLLLALAVCLKPTVAGGLLLYYLIRRRWTIAATTGAVAAAIGCVGLIRLSAAGVPWVHSYLENSRRMFAAGSVDDFTQADRIRFNMINAQILFFDIFPNPRLANLLARFLGGALLSCWAYLCCRRRTGSELLEISAISVLSLIPVYHRFYDATLLIWPLAWALLLLSRRSSTVLSLATIAPFFLPGSVMLSELTRSRKIPPQVAHAWWWSTIVLSHEVSCLILLAGLLLYFLYLGVPEKLPRGEQNAAANPAFTQSLQRSE